MNRLRHILRAALSYYQPGYLASLVTLLERSDYRVGRYLKNYWLTQDFEALSKRSGRWSVRNRALKLFLYLGALLQALVGLAALIQGARFDLAGAIPVGLALIISYPVVWAHMLAVIYAAFKLVWGIIHLKVIGRKVVLRVLEWQVVRLRAKHEFTLIAVAGSNGKTSTKLAIAHSLEPTRRVIYQTGNFNDRVTVPLTIFGRRLPSLLRVDAWLRVFINNERTIARKRFYDIAVVELGTDHPGTMATFAYLKPDLTVLTGIATEHMEFFGTLDAVAAEELMVCDYSKQVLANVDDIPARYLKGKSVLTYGFHSKNPTFKAVGYKPQGLTGGRVELRLQNGTTLKTHAAIVGEQGVKIVLAAAAMAQLVGVDQIETVKGLAEIKPFAGRMQILDGIKGSKIIDDTYNASPVPVIAALDVLYGTKAPQRIAILGSMNELGDYSQQAHAEVGKYCRPDDLDLVVTIGFEAEIYLAPAARAMGCQVQSFASPYQAGEYVRGQLKKGAVVLAAGSQNSVFAEEALKSLLAIPEDGRKLVRQSGYWMGIKNRCFAGANPR